MSTVAVDHATLVDLLRWRAHAEPDRVAFKFLPAGESLTYAELDLRARALAGLLQARGAAGERALLLFRPGLDFVAALFGCLYAGWVAVPVAQAARLSAVASDAQAAAVLTTRALLGTLPPHLPGMVANELPATAAEAWREPPPRPDDLAVLQYTSGSTDTPRGVMLTHANLLHNTRHIEQRFEIDGASRGVIWLPPFHDMGLIGGILQGVSAGFPIALMSPLTFVRRPVAWLEAISREQATISGGPNFAYDLCVQKVRAEERASLDLSCWRVAFNGAEPVRPETLERFSAAFGACGFRREAFAPCYGLAEATLMVSGVQASASASLLTRAGQTLVGCGRAIDGQRIAIVDPTRQIECPAGQVGEIWVSGPSVAAGYWRQPELTCATFQARLADRPEAGPFLRTGDLGTLDPSGELYVTGRLKSVLILAGRKVQAEDIEHTVSEAVGAVVAFSIEDAGRERLVIVQEVEPARATRTHIETVRLAVAERHQVPVWAVVLTRPGTIPRTSSGKVRRQASRTAFLSGHLDGLCEWRA